uniref:Uncharacterized protein n=1 Tax=Oryza glumipatula TaxID=40148 RepID=A0A0E0BSY5_9ORYZ
MAELVLELTGGERWIISACNLKRKCRGVQGKVLGMVHAQRIDKWLTGGGGIDDGVRRQVQNGAEEERGVLSLYDAPFFGVLEGEWRGG